MSDSWVSQAFALGMTSIDNNQLVHEAAHHVLVEGDFGEGVRRKIRPSLIATECRLSRQKKFRGHQAQPGFNWMAVRNGLPSANTNALFARGFLGEGMAVAAMKFIANQYLDRDGTYHQGLGLFDYDVIGCAPGTLFEADPDWLAHPDLLVLKDGAVELIQMKCPSVFAFNRYDKGDATAIKTKYEPQVITEMHVGRKAGFAIERAHIFLFTWEGWQPGTKHAGGVRSISVQVDWQDGMDVFVENIADEIRRDSALIDQGGPWPQAISEEKFDAYPCSYCNWPRIALQEGQIPCTENHQYEEAFKSDGPTG